MYYVMERLRFGKRKFASEFDGISPETLLAFPQIR